MLPKSNVHKGRSAVMLTVLTVAMGLSGIAYGKTLKLITGDGPGHDGTKAMVTWASDLEKESKQGLAGKVYPQTLASAKEVPSTLNSGTADLGYIVYPYFPAEFPEANFIAEFSLFASNTAAAAGAATEYVLNCADCLEELKRHGMIFLGNTANAPYSLITKKPITTHADFQNLKVRSGGEAWGRWIEALGGVKVQLPATEAYQALSQGMLDAHTHSIGSLVDQSLADVAKYVTDIPAGVYFGTSMNFSRKNWDALTDAQRLEIYDRVPYLLSKYISNLVVSRDDVKNNRLDELGVKIVQPAEDLSTAHAEFLKKDKNVIIDNAKKIYGINNAQEKADHFLGLLEKWEKLAEGYGADSQELGDLFKREIFDKFSVAEISR